MNNEQKITLLFSIAILCAIVLLFNLNKGEVQPWDEGLYAFRAKMILKHNCWIDQGKYSLGGLYSSTYPPLVPWAIALNFKIFGEELFSIRLFSALCSLVTIVIFTSLALKNYSSIASFLFGINLFFSSTLLFYSKQGMTDVPLVCFSFFAIFFGIKYIENFDHSKRIIYGILTSVFVFLSFMTKIVLSFLPFVILIALLIIKKKKEFTRLLIYFLIGLVLASPWYIYMSLTYGYDFTNALFPKHLISIVEENYQRLNFLFYFNQLVIANPIYTLGLLGVIFNLYHFRTLLRSKFINLTFGTFFLWSLLGLFVLSIAPTKLPYYTIYLFIPICFVGLDFFENTLPKLNLKIQAFFLIAYFFAFIWYLSPNTRQAISSFKFSDIPFWFYATLVFLILSAISVYFLKENSLENFFRRKFFESSLFLVTSAIIFLNIFQTTITPVGKVFGGKEVANFIQKNRADTFIYLFYKHNDSDTLNPQLAWYFEGEFFGLQARKKPIFVPIPRNKLGLTEIKQTDGFPNKYLVFYFANFTPKVEIAANRIAQKRKVILLEKNYILFSPVVFNKAKSPNQDEGI